MYLEKKNLIPNKNSWTKNGECLYHSGGATMGTPLLFIPHLLFTSLLQGVLGEVSKVVPQARWLQHIQLVRVTAA